jgi:hypothetical protein
MQQQAKRRKREESNMVKFKFKFKPGKDIDDVGQTNAVRAARAEQSIREGFEIRAKDELESVNAADLVGDIFHLCDRNGWDVDDVIRMAIANWKDER